MFIYEFISCGGVELTSQWSSWSRPRGAQVRVDRVMEIRAPVQETSKCAWVVP